MEKESVVKAQQALFTKIKPILEANTNYFELNCH